MEENVQKRGFTRKEYEKFEERLNSSKTLSLSNFQKELNNKIKAKSGKEIVFFDGNQKFAGGSSSRFH